jgi:hypothetical protein
MAAAKVVCLCSQGLLRTPAAQHTLDVQLAVCAPLANASDKVSRFSGLHLLLDVPAARHTLDVQLARHYGL